MKKLLGILYTAAHGARLALANGWPIFALGLALSSVGLWQAWPPAGLIWPGLVLMAIVLFGTQSEKSQ